MAITNVQPADAAANPSRRSILGILAAGSVAVVPAVGAIQRFDRPSGMYPGSATSGASSKGLNAMNMHTAIAQPATSSVVDSGPTAFAKALAQYREAKTSEQAATAVLSRSARACETGKLSTSYMAAEAAHDAALTRSDNCMFRLLEQSAPTLQDFTEQFAAAMQEQAGAIDEDAAVLLFKNLLRLTRA